jgi:hypothetical protein
MAIHLRCGGCGTEALVPDCAPECAAVTGAHLSGCPGADLDALVICPPGSGCCQVDHHHGRAANAGHPLALAGVPGADHDGDCGADNPDCAVCRPITITWYSAGSPLMLQPVTGG